LSGITVIQPGDWKEDILEGVREGKWYQWVIEGVTLLMNRKETCPSVIFMTH
jgi:hypothetical protein